MNPAHLYLGREEAATMVRHPYVSPIFAESFEGLPPLLIQSGGCESLRDEINDLVSKIGATRTTLVHHEEYEVDIYKDHAVDQIVVSSCIP